MEKTEVVIYRLTVTVQYEKGKALDSELIRLLYSIPSHAMANGLFTEDTDAEVVAWAEKVERV